jgi:hypothetical protein
MWIYKSTFFAECASDFLYFHHRILHPPQLGLKCVMKPWLIVNQIKVYRFELSSEKFLWRTIAPALISGDYSLHFRRSGQPVLKGQPSMFLSVSHSAGLGLIAVAPHPLGIDLEVHHQGRDWSRLARRSMPPVLSDWVCLARTERTRQQRFYQAWTQWEAAVKCTGDGLARGRKGISMTTTQEAYSDRMGKIRFLKAPLNASGATFKYRDRRYSIGIAAASQRPSRTSRTPSGQSSRRGP